MRLCLPSNANAKGELGLFAPKHCSRAQKGGGGGHKPAASHPWIQFALLEIWSKLLPDRYPVVDMGQRVSCLLALFVSFCIPKNNDEYGSLHTPSLFGDERLVCRIATPRRMA